jgi:hypothetical protein
MKVLLVELIEVTWDLIDPLIEKGKLPTFARLKREWVWHLSLLGDRPMFTGRRPPDLRQ